ncbi:MAG TPA: MDR family MFS transporter [Thermomicrobiales bacterium]|nr:MDR family MFS transporter [Thermomicrobiales bacterium]
MEVAAEAPARGGGFHTLTRTQLIGTVIGLQLTLLLAALDSTIVGTAMPRIIANLNGFDRYAWVTTAYLLTSTTAVPIFGKLSDIYGRKWFMIVGAVLFVIASAFCGAAGDLPLPGDGMTQLIVFRGIQGIAGGIVTAITFTIVGDIFPPSERGKYQGLFSGVWGLASVFGPTLGGWITDNLSWRWVFYVNLPVGIVAVLVLLFAFPYFKPEGVKHAIDYAGVATLIGCLVPLLLALTWVTEYGWTAPRILGLFALSIVMLAAFIYFEGRAEEPLLPLSLFQNRIVSVSSIALFLTGIGMFGSILFIPLFMQGVSGVSATESGNLLTPLMITLTVFSIISGQLISRVGRYRLIALAGTATMAFGMYLLAGMGGNTSQAVTVRNMVVVGIGLGLTMPLYTLVVQNAVPARMIGTATASTQFFRSIGGTVGAAIFGSVMLNQYTVRFDQLAPTGVPQQVLTPFRNPLQLTQIMPQLEQTFAQLPNGPQLLQSLLGHVKDSLVYSLSSCFWMGTILVAVAFLVTFFLPEIELRKTNREQPATADAPSPVAAAEEVLTGVPAPVGATE